MGPTAGQDAVLKRKIQSLPRPGIEPQSSSPQPSLYTDLATAALLHVLRMHIWIHIVAELFEIAVFIFVGWGQNIPCCLR
jgi:hypothetical protein